MLSLKIVLLISIGNLIGCTGRLHTKEFIPVFRYLFRGQILMDLVQLMVGVVIIIIVVVVVVVVIVRCVARRGCRSMYASRTEIFWSRGWNFLMIRG